MNLWLVSNIRLDASKGLKASGIQNLRTANALARAGHNVVLWCDRIAPGGTSWVRAELGLTFPGSLHLMQATARGTTGQKRSAFGTGRERLWHFLRARLESGAPDAIVSRSPTVLRQLRGSRLITGGTRLILELQYPEWSFLWRDWARRTGNPGVRAGVDALREFRAAEVEGYRAADGILYAARAHEALLERAGYTGRRAWIPSGAEAPEPGPASGAPDFDLGYVGSIAPENGLELLLTAVSRLKSRRLLVLGSGRSRFIERLEAQARELRIDNLVEFAGRVSPAEVRGWMRRCAVGVVPLSRRQGPEKRQYASPLKQVEWMAAGVPVLGSRVPSLVQHQAEGDPIELFEADDAESLASSVARMLEDSLRRRRMAEAGLEAAGSRSFDERARIMSDFAASLEGTAVSVHGHS